MSLTYHPFENVPALEAIGQSLRKNVPGEERTLSGIFGLLLLNASRNRESGLRKWLMLGAGAAMLGRAWTGHCPLYEELEVADARQRHSQPQEAS